MYVVGDTADSDKLLASICENAGDVFEEIGFPFRRDEASPFADRKNKLYGMFVSLLRSEVEIVHQCYKYLAPNGAD